jgi:AAA lid domain
MSDSDQTEACRQRRITGAWQSSCECGTCSACVVQMHEHTQGAWRDRYIPDRRLPDSAIDVIDEAAARVRCSAQAARQTDSAPSVDAAQPRSACGGAAPLETAPELHSARSTTGASGRQRALSGERVPAQQGMHSGSVLPGGAASAVGLWGSGALWEQSAAGGALQALEWAAEEDDERKPPRPCPHCGNPVPYVEGVPPRQTHGFCSEVQPEHATLVAGALPFTLKKNSRGSCSEDVLISPGPKQDRPVLRGQQSVLHFPQEGTLLA